MLQLIFKCIVFVYIWPSVWRVYTLHSLYPVDWWYWSTDKGPLTGQIRPSAEDTLPVSLLLYFIFQTSALSLSLSFQGHRMLSGHVALTFALLTIRCCSYGQCWDWKYSESGIFLGCKFILLISKEDLGSEQPLPLRIARSCSQHFLFF